MTQAASAANTAYVAINRVRERRISSSLNSHECRFPRVVRHPVSLSLVRMNPGWQSAPGNRFRPSVLERNCRAALRGRHIHSSNSEFISENLLCLRLAVHQVYVTQVG